MSDSEQIAAPTVNREALARAINDVDYYGLNLGGKVTLRSYETADALLASGILQDAAVLEREAEARGLEKAAEAWPHEQFPAAWMRGRAQQVREETK